MNDYEKIVEAAKRTADMIDKGGTRSTYHAWRMFAEELHKLKQHEADTQLDPNDVPY